MYHDQVLTPIKSIFGFNAINVTLGLPFIRISPDHGPNTEMIGKNRSNPQSLIKAISFLDKLNASQSKKSLGQNFLFDKNILKIVIECAEIKDKEILEVGPGTGNLTMKS